MTFSQNELTRFLQIAKSAAALAEPILLKYFGQLESVDEKYQAGLVTQADIESERVITEFLKKETPDFDILGEEASFLGNSTVDFNAKGRKPCWIVDPLDGTTNFVHGFPIFCISIGLEVQGQSFIGVIHAPVMKQMFWASKGGGAWMNGKPLHVSQRNDINDVLVATGFVPSHKDKLHQQLRLFNHVISKVRGIRRAGAAAYDLAMIASGVFDAFWEECLNPWDTCAGVILVEEAGGRVTQFDESPYTPFCESILASNSMIHHQISSLLK